MKRSPQIALQQEYASDGIEYSTLNLGAPDWLKNPDALPSGDRPLAAYLDQLLVEGIASERAGSLLLPWDAVYHLRSSEDHADSYFLLRLPADSDWAPQLTTSGALSDSTFQLAITAWWSTTLGSVTPSRTGAVLHQGECKWLMPERAWDLVQHVTRFAKECAGLSYPDRLREVGELRSAAQTCGARLDDYLQRTDIRTPDRLQIELKREEALGMPVVEVVPGPEGVPANFVDVFDRYSAVQQRYDLVQPDGGMTHVAPSPAVRAALGAIKRLPGRRLSSEQAALFAYNPHAVLGEEAASALDDDQIDQARLAAGLVPSHLRFLPEQSTASFAAIEIAVDASDAAPERLKLNNSQVQQLIAAAGRSRSRALPIFQWEGNEILCDAAAENELAALTHWRALSAATRSTPHAAELLDLAAYSPRVTGFDSKVQAVPYVAHQTHGKKWLPEDDIGIVTVDSQTGAVQKHRMTPESVEALQRALDEATEQGQTTVRIPDSNTEVTLSQAEGLAASLREVGLAKHHPAEPRPISNPKPDQRAGLRIHHNIESLDYVEAVEQMVGEVAGGNANLPVALNPGVSLLPHQQHGLAWLQRRYLNRDHGIAGCLLADDMGLGKTLQSLALVAWAGERSHFEIPSLVVAPVSLLDNWKQEIAKFLNWPSGSVLSLYGSELSGRCAGEDQIDDELKSLGVRKLLRKGFADGFNLVLTTYETLRDYQLSIGRQSWDIVVCDEAQKIKNPSAFVTQAAKALRARFKIACTGTPVENSLADLWCLFDFFQPGCLGALNEFTKSYRTSIEARREGHEALIERLRTMIEPWVLRRMKSEVHGGLPQKLTGRDADAAAMGLAMSSDQLMAYTKALAVYREAQKTGGKQGANALLPLLHRLRMICAYPMAEMRPDHEQAPVAEHLRVSPKLVWLMQRLDDISRLGEKAIVFTDYRAVQRLIQRTVENRFGFRPCIINGSTTANADSDHSRQKLIDEFQQAEGFGVLILGTTAVGFGVNIQEANHVIHFTRSWNPAKEDQATDRAYRIGQARDVYVYCPTVAGNGFESFEQRLAERLDYKRGLSADMLAGQQELSMEDFRDI